jgi:hypothetical protein
VLSVFFTVFPVPSGDSPISPGVSSEAFRLVIYKVSVINIAI